MFAKVYWVIWGILGLVTLGLFFAGSLTLFSVTVLGFIACTMIFVGMMCVTISIVGPHAKEYQHDDAEPLPEKKLQAEPTRNSLPAGVAIQSRHAH
ncbi:MAG: hypothetical protein JO314_07645 [Acidobacteria bacterium]|nr:hypothetical protein [Acidobacteriota bacterium]